MVDQISGGFRLAQPALAAVTKRDVADLLSRIRSDPRVREGRSAFEFRVVDSGNGRYLELRKQTGFGRFKEAIGWGTERRRQERDAGLAVLSNALGDELTDRLFESGGMSKATAQRGSSRAAVAFALDQDLTDGKGKIPDLDGADRPRATPAASAISEAQGLDLAERPAIPRDADASMVTQYHGTNTCWALSTLMGCLKLDEGRAFLDKHFTRNAEGYQLKPETGEAITITAADLAGINETRKTNNRSTYGMDDTRPEWLRAFEAACTRLDKGFEAAAVHPTQGTGEVDDLAARIGMEVDFILPLNNGNLDLTPLRKALDDGKSVMVMFGGHCHVLDRIEGDAIVVTSTLGGEHASGVGDYQPAQMSKTLSTEQIKTYLMKGEMSLCSIAVRA